MSTESIHLAGGPFLPRLEMRDGKKRCRGSQLELCTGKLSVEIALGFMVPHLPEATASVLGNLGSQALRVFCRWKNTDCGARV